VGNRSIAAHDVFRKFQRCSTIAERHASKPNDARCAPVMFRLVCTKLFIKPGKTVMNCFFA